MPYYIQAEFNQKTPNVIFLKPKGCVTTVLRKGIDSLKSGNYLVTNWQLSFEAMLIVISNMTNIISSYEQ